MQNPFFVPLPHSVPSCPLCLSISNPASSDRATPWETKALLPKFKEQILQ